MINIEIAGIGTAIPENYIDFNSGRRFRITEKESQLDLLSRSAIRALEDANMTIDDIDAIVGAVAVGVQPIPLRNIYNIIDIP